MTREPRHDLTIIRGACCLIVAVLLVWLAVAMLRAAHWGMP